jgi:L-amino acid N-acyltransferase YncA
MLRVILFMRASTPPSQEGNPTLFLEPEGYNPRLRYPMELSIREATPDDAAGIVAVFNPIIEARSFTTFDSPFSIEAERSYIAGLTPRDIFHVAVRVSDDLIVGFQSMSPFAAFTRAFDHVGVIGTYVDLASRRQGIAGSLFPATFEAAQRKGYEKIFTYIRADNPAALAAYQKHGFQIAGKADRHAKLHGRFVDVIMVERFL